MIAIAAAGAFIGLFALWVVSPEETPPQIISAGHCYGNL